MNTTEPPNQREIKRLKHRGRKLVRQWQRNFGAYQDGLLEKDELEHRKYDPNQEQAYLQSLPAHTAEILQNALHVKLLVTSREWLNLRVEQVFSISGLPFTDKLEAPEIVVKSPAAQLFLQSAQRFQPSFQIRDDEELTSLALICQLVGGMPLALELAAEWTNLLSMTEIAAEIQRSLDSLEAFEAKQQTIIVLAEIVNPFFINHQCIGQGTDFQQSVPIAVGARQARSFQTEDSPSVTKANLCDERLKTVPTHRRCARKALVLVDHNYAIPLPAQIQGALDQVVLSGGAGSIVTHLHLGRLAHVDESLAFQVFRSDFLSAEL